MKKTLRLTSHLMKKLNVFPLISGTRLGYPFSLVLFNVIVEMLARAVKQEKGIQMRRKK